MSYLIYFPLRKFNIWLWFFFPSIMVVIGEGESREMDVVMLTKTLYIGSAKTIWGMEWYCNLASV